MSSDPLELKEKFQAEYHARWEAVEIFKARELAAMTEERARLRLEPPGLQPKEVFPTWWRKTNAIQRIPAPSRFVLIRVHS